MGAVQKESNKRAGMNLLLAEKVDELATLYHLSSALQRDMELEGRLKDILRTVTVGAGFDRATLLLVDEKQRFFSSGITSDGLSYSPLPKFRAPLEEGNGVAVETMLDRKTHFGKKGVDRPLKDPELSFFGDESFVSVPLMGKGKVVGVLVVDNFETGRPIKRGRKDFLEVLGNLAGIAIENVSLHEELKGLAVTDGLTRLYNRSHFDSQLRKEIERAKRYGHPLSAAILDIDGFKEFNDRRGHLAGDGLLVRVASILRKKVREADFVARYGGDEFVVLLPETEKEGALAFAERVRRKVQESSQGGQESPSPTVSIGVASFPYDGANAKQLFEAADKALYWAKNKGGNLIGGGDDPNSSAGVRNETTP